MRTCKKCGTVTKTKKEKPVIDQATCLHGVTERTGSSRKTSRLRCKLCGMLLDEQPQDERKKRTEIAATVQESNTLDFDLLRSIASRTSEDLPVEVSCSRHRPVQRNCGRSLRDRILYNEG